jgi:hypothetical protein
VLRLYHTAGTCWKLPGARGSLSLLTHLAVVALLQELLEAQAELAKLSPPVRNAPHAVIQQDALFACTSSCVPHIQYNSLLQTAELQRGCRWACSSATGNAAASSHQGHRGTQAGRGAKRGACAGRSSRATPAAAAAARACPAALCASPPGVSPAADLSVVLAHAPSYRHNSPDPLWCASGDGICGAAALWHALICSTTASAGAGGACSAPDAAAARAGAAGLRAHLQLLLCSACAVNGRSCAKLLRTGVQRHEELCLACRWRRSPKPLLRRRHLRRHSSSSSSSSMRRLRRSRCHHRRRRPHRHLPSSSSTLPRPTPLSTSSHRCAPLYHIVRSQSTSACVMGCWGS